MVLFKHLTGTSKKINDLYLINNIKLKPLHNRILIYAHTEIKNK